MGASINDSRRFQADSELLVRGLRYALRRLPIVKVVWLQNYAGVDFVFGMNTWSWGERVKVRIGDDGEVSIESRCRFPLQFFDSGKNARNVQLIFEWIDEYIELFGAARTNGT